MDYLCRDEEMVDASKVAIMGHSKLGKIALWAAAQDSRIALVVASQSGCGGAALWRRRVGETLHHMVTRLPYWLCRNAGKFVGQEDDLPLDQHMLFVTSGLIQKVFSHAYKSYRRVHLGSVRLAQINGVYFQPLNFCACLS
jgi:hypothetical protein